MATRQNPPRRRPASAQPETAMTLATDLDRLAVDTIRTLSIDGVQQANSGHPGAPMGAAPMAYALWTRHLRHSPTNPAWPDRDRFVLSAGHASMLLYSLLHLTGYDVSLDDLKAFRQWGSITPGPPGVRPHAGRRGDDRAARAGPRQRHRHGDRGAPARRASSTGRGTTIVDHRTYVIASDGDMQEGVASEACSLAGHLKLGKLVVLYDDNRIQLDGPTELGVQRGRRSPGSTPTAGTPSGSRTATTSPRSRPPSTPPRPTTGRPSSPSAPTSASAARTSRTPRRRTGRRSGRTRSSWSRRPTAGTPTARSTCPTRR